jgi:DNA polymerase delta subunit 4
MPLQPCVGITRRKRWLRAHRLGLAPPIEALAVLVKGDKKGTKGIEKAQLEELLATTGGMADQS